MHGYKGPDCVLGGFQANPWFTQKHTLHYQLCGTCVVRWEEVAWITSFPHPCITRLQWEMPKAGNHRFCTTNLHTGCFCTTCEESCHVEGRGWAGVVPVILPPTATLTESHACVQGEAGLRLGICEHSGLTFFPARNFSKR